MRPYLASDNWGRTEVFISPGSTPTCWQHAIKGGASYCLNMSFIFGIAGKSSGVFVILDTAPDSP